VITWFPWADAPWICAVYVPLGEPTFSTSAVEVLPVVELGVKPRKSVGGRPVTVKFTAPVNPALRVMVIRGGVVSWLFG
jgi:hypothetical protein